MIFRVWVFFIIKEASMPFLQGSGAISLNNIKTLFGGPVSPSLGNYYRGGTYIPATKSTSTVVREPASGQYYSGAYLWWFDTYGGQIYINWANAQVYYQFSQLPSTTSVTVSGVTYFRGSLQTSGASNTKGYTRDYYGVYRTYVTNSTTNINTNIPTSGAISLSQFYNAEKPWTTQ